MQRALVLVALVLVITDLDAQGPAPSPLIPHLPPAPVITSATAAAQASPAPELTKPDLEAFLDALIPSQLQNRNMAGAVVSVVKDGQLLLAKGYGYADFAGKKPVVPHETLFRPGSISKLFTAIAVMQLAEKGQLDLDKDINEYLDFQIPKTYAEPITPRRLLTHTAGFEEALKNLFVPGAQQMKSLHDYLLAAMPARIFPPGKIPAYSNYGLCLAGYIVQRVSGESFDVYVADHILKPLKMQSSTFTQLVPETLVPHMSNGYLIATKPAKSFEFVQAAPAGSLSTTATDMSRFMLALLQGGTLEDATILKPETIRAMESRQFELHPELNGVGFVFFDYSTNGQRIVGHGGDTLWFHSDMYLLLDVHVGLFISYNSAGLPRPTSARNEVERAFLDRYFPDMRPHAKDVDLAVAQNDARTVSGVYQTTRRGETTLLKIATLFGQTAVTSDRNGVLTIQASKNLRGELKKWREVGPLIYNEVDGPGAIAFRRDASGKVNELLPQLPVFEFQRVPWYENQHIIYPILAVALGLPILTVLCWPVAALVRKRYHRQLFATAGHRVIYFLSRVVCFLEFGYVVIFGVLLSRAGENVSLLGDGLDPWLNVLHVVGWSIAAGIILLIVSAARFWKIGGWWPRTHATLLALSGVAFVLIAWHWHVLDASNKF